MSSLTPEMIVYLLLSFVQQKGGVDAARLWIEDRMASGKTFDEILDEMQALRRQEAKDAQDAVDKMPG